jgi:OHCU decarboxylase
MTPDPAPIAAFNALDAADAERVLLDCCGSTRWARAMVAARPFADLASMTARADVVWSSLAVADWLEAFAAHPRIGSSASRRADPPDAIDRAAAWSSDEQRGVASADADVRARLADVNGLYLARFGYIFIVCASGRTAADMLATAERRLTNAPEDEIRIAAEEQRTITRLRLSRLFDR